MPSQRRSRGSCTLHDRSHEFFRHVGPLVIIVCPGGFAAAASVAVAVTAAIIAADALLLPLQH